MTLRIRLALLFVVFAALLAARAGVAFAAAKPRHHAHRARVTHALLVQREQRRLVRFARRFLGVRYVYGGTSPRYGFDCSGFTRFVYAHFGVSLPHYSGAQFDRGHSVSRRRLRPGDLVFFDGLGHVGIYLGRGRFIHAPHTGTDVEIDTLNGWYGAQYDGARRIF